MSSQRRRVLLATAAILTPAAYASAQEAPRTIPGLENYSLPGTPTQAPIPSTSCTNPRNSATTAERASTASTTPSTQFIAGSI